jgi:hypothetical protein
VSGGKLSETAELKAIRENLLRVRMSEWLQLPKEAPWLDSTIKVFVAVLRRIWKSGTDIATIKTLSDWIVDQIDIRGWIHRLGPDVGNDILTTGRGAYILLLLMPPSEVPREVKDAYWEWVEDRVLAQIKDEVPNLYHWIVERQKQMIFELADTDLNEGSSS